MKRFIGGLLMAIGALVALTTGLCSLYASFVMVTMAFGKGGDASMLLFLVIPGFCFVITLGGIGLFRVGLDKAREAGDSDSAGNPD
jgi:hypothetical protein